LICLQNEKDWPTKGQEDNKKKAAIDDAGINVLDIVIEESFGGGPARTGRTISWEWRVVKETLYRVHLG